MSADGLNPPFLQRYVTRTHFRNPLKSPTSHPRFSTIAWPRLVHDWDTRFALCWERSPLGRSMNLHSIFFPFADGVVHLPKQQGRL